MDVLTFGLRKILNKNRCHSIKLKHRNIQKYQKEQYTASITNDLFK